MMKFHTVLGKRTNESSRVMKIGKAVLKSTGTIFVGGACFTAYYYPELRKEPMQMFFAMRRGVRCLTTGSLMAKDYL